MPVDWKLVCAVALGGAAGSAARFLLSGWILARSEQDVLPYGTFAVNVLGAFLIGFLVRASGASSPWLQVLLVPGLLGGFTTFSAFSYETYRLMEAGRHGWAAGYAALSVALCLLGVWLGQSAGRWAAPE